MFGMFHGMFFLVFFAVFAVIIFSIGKSALQWGRNNRQPVLTVPAEVVAKREHVSGHHGHNNMHYHSSTSYYVTFEVESGDRMELQVNGDNYGYMIEGDFGRLTFQGTRFLSFDRG
ncbi:MAG: DUF2500 domain-containing protein [Lachnospiraceae bacterium]|nr:DUF2500 domain-containing protein [Lachnospiraceae bacterium]